MSKETRNAEDPSLTNLSMEARRAARGYAVRMYAAGALWLVAVAGVVAASAGITHALWVAFPAAVAAGVIGSVRRSPILHRLDAQEGRHALPVLADHIEALMASNPERTVAALHSLLPTMLEPDAPALTDAQWNGLAWVLRTADVEKHADLIAALLNVMGARAPTRMASAVAQHAAGPAASEAEMRVRKAGKDALQAMVERAHREREAVSLLRPAEADPDPSRALVRPAEAAPATDDTLLVRSADKEGGA